MYLVGRIRLTDKQRLFCMEYLTNGFNATKAAIAAGYSKKTAYSQGQRLLKNVEIRRYLEQRKNTTMKKLEISLERTLQEIAAVAYSNIADVLKAKKVSELPEEVQRAISEVTTIDTKHGKRRTIKLHNKLTALDMLMKHFGAYASIKDIIDGLTDEQAERILNELQTRLQSNQCHENN